MRRNYKIFTFFVALIFLVFVPTVIFLKHSDNNSGQSIELGEKFYSFFSTEASLAPNTKIEMLKSFIESKSGYTALAEFKLASFMVTSERYKEAIEIYEDLKFKAKSESVRSLAEYLYMLTLFKAGENTKLEQEFAKYKEGSTKDRPFLESVKSLEAIFYASIDKPQEADMAIFEISNSPAASKQLLKMTKDSVGAILDDTHSKKTEKNHVN